MHRRKNYRKPVTTKLPASVGIAMTGDVVTTVGNRGVTTVVTTGAIPAAVARDAVNSARSAEPVAGEIATVVSAAVAGIATAIRVRANCRSRRKACA